MNVKVVLFKVIIVLLSLVNIVTVKAEEPIGTIRWMFSADKGQTITVTDKNGNVKDYEIYKIFKIDNYWYDLDGNDLLGFYEHFNEKPKEEILLQTCQNLDIKLIIVARAEEGKR